MNAEYWMKKKLYIYILGEGKRKSKEIVWLVDHIYIYILLLKIHLVMATNAGFIVYIYNIKIPWLLYTNRSLAQTIEIETD